MWAQLPQEVHCVEDGHGSGESQEVRSDRQLDRSRAGCPGPEAEISDKEKQATWIASIELEEEETLRMHTLQ